MVIVPKLGTENIAVPDLILPYLRDTVEFQLESYTEGEQNWRGIVEHHGLKTVILHAPFGQHNLEDVVLSTPLHDLVASYVLRQLEYAEMAGIHLKMLFHVSLPVESMQHLPIIQGIHELISLLDHSPRITYLIENTIVNLDVGTRRLLNDPITYILNNTPADVVQVCFDLCHYLASKNAVQEEYIFPVEWLPRLFSIHFSETKNNEGYRHFSTSHGRCHDSIYGVARDLCILSDLGLDLHNTLIVSEVTEPDYFVRTGEAQELMWLHTINRDGIYF